MTDVSTLLGQLIGNAQYATKPGVEQMIAGNGQQAAPQGVGLPSLEQAPSDLTGIAAARPFTHEQIATKHGLSNILSIIGDAFLASHGLKPRYLPGIDAAREADALDGFEDDPMSAIHRLTSAGFGDKARDLFNDLQSNLYKHQLAQNAADQDARAAAIAPIQQQVEREKLFGPAASMAMGATRDSSGNSWPSVRNRIASYMTARGLQDHLDGLPDKFDPSAISQWASGAISPDKQVDNQRQQDSLDQQKHYEDASLGLRGEEIGNQSRNIDDEIGYRAWQKAHGDTGTTNQTNNTNSEIEYRKWLMAHPSKQRAGGGGASSVPTFDPAKYTGHTTVGTDGSTWVSDGKKWTKK
jgi:hypothetical protein